MTQSITRVKSPLDGVEVGLRRVKSGNLLSSWYPMCIPQSNIMFRPFNWTTTQLLPTSWPAPKATNFIFPILKKVYGHPLNVKGKQLVCTAIDNKWVGGGLGNWTSPKSHRQLQAAVYPRISSLKFRSGLIQYLQGLGLPTTYTLVWQRTFTTAKWRGEIWNILIVYWLN